jgi:uncharacterized protein YukE
MSSDHLAMHQHELRAAHAAADSAMAEAQPRWVGASASAMHAGLVRWREETDILVGDIGAQADDLRSAAYQYALADIEGADAVDSRR